MTSDKKKPYILKPDGSVIFNIEGNTGIHFRKISKRKCWVNITTTSADIIDMSGKPHIDTHKWENLASSMSRKKSMIFQDLFNIIHPDKEIDLATDDEISKLQGKIREVASYVMVRWEALNITKTTQSQFSDPNDPRPNDTENIIFSPEDRAEAIEFLKDLNNLFRIEAEMEREYTGQEEAKVYGFIKGIQSYTPAYAQMSAVAGSSVGKSKLFTTIFGMFPPEHTQKLLEFSPTALRYAQKEGLLDGVRNLIIGQREGVGSRYHVLMVSRDDKDFMECWITNRDTGTIDKLEIPHLSMWNTSTNFYLADEHDTRTDRIFLDESVTQNWKAGKFMADRWRIDNDIREEMGLLNPSEIKTIRNAVRVFSEEIYPINIPFAGYAESLMDHQKQRYKRDLDSFFGMISALANWRRYNREFLIVGDEVRVLAEWEDLEDAIKYGDVHISQTYFNVPNKLKPVLNILREAQKSEWVHEGYVYIDDLGAKCREKDIQRSTVHNHLRELVEDVGIVSRRKISVLDKEGNAIKTGYWYRSEIEIADSMFSEKASREKAQLEIEKYKSEMTANGGRIVSYEELKKLRPIPLGRGSLGSVDQES